MIKSCIVEIEGLASLGGCLAQIETLQTGGCLLKLGVRNSWLTLKTCDVYKGWLDFTKLPVDFHKFRLYEIVSNIVQEYTSAY